MLLDIIYTRITLWFKTLRVSTNKSTRPKKLLTIIMFTFFCFTILSWFSFSEQFLKLTLGISFSLIFRFLHGLFYKNWTIFVTKLWIKVAGAGSWKGFMILYVKDFQSYALRSILIILPYLLSGSLSPIFFCRKIPP